MFLRLPDSLDRGSTDPRIRIRIRTRTKMSRIHNTARNCSTTVPAMQYYDYLNWLLQMLKKSTVLDMRGVFLLITFLYFFQCYVEKVSFFLNNLEAIFQI
jgi:hypothetical protein